MKNVIRNGRPLREMPYAQARVVEEGNNLKLYSYQTLVAEYKDGWIYCYGLYSVTTRRHISKFAKEISFLCTYQLFKMCYEDKIRINLNTRVIEDL